MNERKPSSTDIRKKEIEMKRQKSYEINFKIEDEKELQFQDDFNENDFNENESTPKTFVKKKGLLVIPKKMKYFCFVLFILIAFLSVNISLLVLSKSHTVPVDSIPSTDTKISPGENNMQKTNETQNIENITDNVTTKPEEMEILLARRISFLINQSEFSKREENINSKFIPLLNVSIFFENENEFNIKITDAENRRFALPEVYPFPFTKNITDPDQEMIKTNYLVEINTSNFSIQVRRKSTKEVIFDSSGIEFHFTDRFIEFGTRLPSEYLFGLGERKARFLYQSGAYTIWNRLSGGELDNGTPGHQSSGTHPVYLMREASGLFHVTLLKSVNAMQFEFNENNELKFKLNGGIIDLKFFLGNEYPESAIKQYHSFINGFSTVPFWAFGIHQAIIGQIKPEKISLVSALYRRSSFPIDAYWSDIELMHKCNKSNDHNTFEVLKQIKKKAKFINQINMAIPLNPDNEFFTKAMEEDILIKSAKTRKPMLACQCSNKSVFPDFNNPNVSNYWFFLLDRYHKKTLFDGVSLTLNEPTLALDSPEELKSLEETCSNPDTEPFYQVFENFTGWIDDSLDKIDLSALPFFSQQNLEKETFSLDSYHYNESEFFKVKELRELDFHNLNGFMSVYYTSVVLKHFLTNPFISTKSTVFGTGNFATHWSGETLLSWSSLKASIASLFNANLFGIPISGIDICSFSEYPNSELCARWIQLGSLYPLTRFRISDNPYDLGIFSFNESFVLEAAKASFKLRYSLLKYFFGIFERKKGLGSVFMPLFFEFPDETSLFDIETQFMFGPDIMVTPVLESNTELVSVYFPRNIKWVNFNTGEVFVNHEGFKQDVSAPLNDTCPIFVREGRIIPFQKVENVTNSFDLGNNFNLFAMMKNNLKPEFYAEGELFTLADYHDNKKLDECRENSNQRICSILVKIKSSILGPPDFLTSITIEFEAGENTILDEIYVEELRLLGMPNKNQFTEKIVKFDPKLKVEKNFSKTFINS